MTSLADTALFSKKFLIWLGMGIGGVFLIFIFWTIGKYIKNAVSPAKPLPALVAFGKIPKEDLSEGIKSKSGITYLIETVSGDLPQLSANAKVFEIDQKESSFGALENVKQIVTSMGFSGQPELLEDNNVVFKLNNQDQNKTLKINIISQNLDFETGFVNDREIINGKPNTIEAAINSASEFFGRFNFDTDEFPKEKAETKLLRIDGIILTGVPAFSSANLVEVVFRRVDVDKIPVIYPRESIAPAKALVSGKGIAKAEINKNDVNYFKFSTYPLKGAKSAFEELRAGKGFFNKEFSETQFTIRDVFLAYLETQTAQKYLQPIYVFKSDNGLVAYVDAVDGKWIVN